MALPSFKSAYTYFSDFNNSFTLTGVDAVAGDVILLCATGRAGVHNFATPTWNGESFTEVSSNLSDPLTVELFALKCASTGVFDISSDGGGYSGVNCVALVYSGTFSTTFIDSLVNTDTLVSYSLPSAVVAGVNADSIAINFLAAPLWDLGYNTVSTTYTTSGTSRANIGNAMSGVGRLYASQKAGSGTVTDTYTRSNTDETQYRLLGFRLFNTSGPSQSVDTYPTAVRSGSTGNAYTTTGLSNVTSITIGILAATGISDTSGDGTHSIPSLTDGVAHELYGTQTVTITGTGGSPTTTTSFQPLPTQNFITLSGTLNTTNTGVLYNFSPAAVVGDQIVFLTANNTSVDAQGNLATDLVGTQQMWHIQASTKIARSYDVTTGNAAGVTYNITGLSTTMSRGTVTGVSGGIRYLMTGLQAVTSRGTITQLLAGVTYALTGLSTTMSRGNITGQSGGVIHVITGLSATASRGTISAVSGGVRYLITGLQALMSRGNITSSTGVIPSTDSDVSVTKPISLNIFKRVFKRVSRKLYTKREK